MFEMCDLKAAKKICTMQNLDIDLSNSEQLFNRQFMSLSHAQSNALCQQRKMGCPLGSRRKAERLWTAMARPAC